MREKKCQHFYDIDSPEVVSGEREPGYCGLPVFKGKGYCIDHCADRSLLSQKDAVAYERERDNRRGEISSSAKKMIDMFSDENFDAEYTYRYLRTMRIAKPGEENLEMYVYASWKFSDRDTRSPESEVKLADILGVKVDRFREWDENPELHIMMNNMLEKLVDIVGKTMFWKGAITRLHDEDKVTRNKAWEFLGKRYAKAEEDASKEIKLELPESAVPVLNDLLKHLGRMEPEGDDGRAVKAGAVMRELSGGAIDD